MHVRALLESNIHIEYTTCVFKPSMQGQLQLPHIASPQNCAPRSFEVSYEMAYENLAGKYLKILKVQLLLTEEKAVGPDEEATSILLVCKYYILPHTAT